MEVSTKFMERRSPFGMTDPFLLTMGFDAGCETLTILGVEPQTLLDLGLVVVNESGDVILEHDDMIDGLRDELPAEQFKPEQPKQSILPTIFHNRPRELKLVRPLRQCQRFSLKDLQIQ